VTEQEKNDLYLKYKKRIYFIANRYRFLDPDIEEIAAWGALGFAKALNYHEKNPDLSLDAIIFSRVKIEIFDNLKRDRSNEVSMHAPVAVGKDGEGATLESFLAADEVLVHDELDVARLINKALRKEKKTDREIAADLFLFGLDSSAIAKKYNISKGVITKIKRRSQIKIKKYMADNDIIESTVDYLLVSNNNANKQELKHAEYEAIKKQDYGKLKYITNHYPFLSHRDIAIVLGLKTSSISQLLENKTIGYLKIGEDITVHDQVERYVQKWYPGQAAGQLVVIS
jgi:RNA polymerase sigma factor (sigma-70 family)